MVMSLEKLQVDQNNGGIKIWICQNTRSRRKATTLVCLYWYEGWIHQTADDQDIIGSTNEQKPTYSGNESGLQSNSAPLGCHGKKQPSDKAWRKIRRNISFVKLSGGKHIGTV